MIRFRVGSGGRTGWHHNGYRRVFGYVVTVHAVLEYWSDGTESVSLDAGSCICVPLRTIRRVVNLSEDWEIVIGFVGSELPAVSVNGSEHGDE